mmetsp:Transcript_39304/g.87892  ORF Transcript_39304/g.87892 Transcript_39304/m.87892 type:complete len:377 (+) Transcript_39304:110-1240(+)
MVHDGLTRRRTFRAEERGQQADAVLAGVVREFGAEYFCAGRQEVGVADHVVAARAGLHPRRPAHEERYAMPAVPDVGFVAAKLGAGEVTSLFQVVGAAGAVVARENDERVFGEFCVVQGGKHLADRGVGLHDEIAVLTEAALSLPLRRGHVRPVRGVQRQVDEERLARFGVGGALVDDLDGLTGERGQHIDRFKARRGGTCAHPCFLRGRGLGVTVVFDEGEGRHIERRADAKEVVEPARDGSVGDRVGELLSGREVHAEMPFPDRGSVIAVLFEEGRRGQTVGRDQWFRVAVENAALQPRAPGVAPSEETVARGCADGGTAVGIGENHPLPRQLVEVRRFDFSAQRIKRLHVSVTKVVGQDIYYIGLGVRLSSRG